MGMVLWLGAGVLALDIQRNFNSMGIRKEGT